MPGHTDLLTNSNLHIKQKLNLQDVVVEHKVADYHVFISVCKSE